MLYGLAKFLAPLASPLGLVWLLLVALAAWLLKRRQWVGGGFALGLAALMSLAGSRLPVHLLTTLERPYVRGSLTNVPSADAVVLLGGWFEYSRNEPMGFNLSAGADRALTALELVRLKKSPALVLGGRGIKMDGVFGNEAHAISNWLANWKLSDGVPVFILDGSGNTHDEAVKTAVLAREKGWEKIHLVTTGTHMRRAEATFRTAGLEVVPVACDFVRLGTPFEGAELSVIPTTGGFRELGLYLHERAGWLVYRMNGWIDSAAADTPPGSER